MYCNQAAEAASSASKLAGESQPRAEWGADGVVKGFEIGKDIVLCSCPCRIVLEVDQLTLEAAEKVLRNGVVIRSRDYPIICVNLLRVVE